MYSNINTINNYNKQNDHSINDNNNNNNLKDQARDKTYERDRENKLRRDNDGVAREEGNL
jgi:hypothetical protein